MGFWGYSLHGQVDKTTSPTSPRPRPSATACATSSGAFQAAQAREAAQEVRTGAVVGLVTGRVNWERIIRDLSAAMPREVWLTNLKGETDPAAATATPTAGAATVNNSTAPRGIHLDGYAYNQNAGRPADGAGGHDPRPRRAPPREQRGAGPATSSDVIHFVIDIPIDQRAQDRSTLTPVNGAATSTASGVTP